MAIRTIYIAAAIQMFKKMAGQNYKFENEDNNFNLV